MDITKVNKCKIINTKGVIKNGQSMARDTGNIGQKTQKKANKAKHIAQKTKRMSNTNHQITEGDTRCSRRERCPCFLRRYPPCYS